MDSGPEPIPIVGSGVRITQTPANPTKERAASFTVECETEGCSPECRLDAAEFAACTSPAQFTALADGPHAFEARAAGATGTPARFEWVVDATAPAVSILSGPPALTSQTTADFTFGCSETGCTFECSLDGATASACPSPAQFSPLTEGAHGLSVRALDALGNRGEPAVHNWTVNATVPMVTISSAPPSLTNQTEATFAFTCSLSGCTFACSLDGAAAVSCVSPAGLTGLSPGAHTFAITATSAAAVTGPAQTHAWTVDTAAPVVSFTAAPPAATAQTDATFAFSCDETACTFVCRLDGAAPSACTSPDTRSSLADGAHTFAVTATDAAGNTGAAATHAWTINSALPGVSIGSAPAALTNQTSAAFSFTCSQAGCTFECALDGAAMAACVSPKSYTALAAGAHSFAVRATNGVGVTGPSTTHAWNVDITGPAVTFTSTPPTLTNQTAASFAFGCGETGCTFTCRLDAAAASACSSPVALTGLTPGAHTFTVIATDAAGNAGAASTHGWTVDTVAPTVTFSSAPPNPTGQTSATFTFGCSEAGCTFSCSLDGAAASACTSPVAQSGLADGPHTFSVTATDPAGNTGAAATHSWSVNSAIPTVTISAAPSSPTNQTSASFTFACSEAGCTFLCSLDGGAAASCTSPRVYAVAAGSHTFSVTATNAVGTSSAPATHTWTVDTLAPTVTVSAGPPAVTGSTSASFTFGANETGCTFMCSLDGAAPVSCTSPRSYSGLAGGAHTFTVTATDPAGNTGAPATRTWTVDLIPPTVTFTTAPANPNNNTTATFAFNASETGCTYTCSLDGAAPSSCSSGISPFGIGAGSHTFTVIATDAAGNAGPPATHAWTVDLTAPTVSLAGGPPSPTTQTSASFTFTCNEAPCTFLCALDGAPMAACTSPRDYPTVADGAHSFVVRSRDSAGNLSVAATHNWTVDSTPPNTTITSGPASGPATDVTFSFTANEAGTFACRLDGAAFAPCTSPTSYAGLALGQHTFQVRATDALGLTDATPASWTWYVATTYISSVSPRQGTVTVPLIIEGAGFGAVQGASTVTVGGVPAVVRSWSDSYLVVMVPAGLAAGDAAVAISPFPTAVATYTVVPWIRLVNSTEPNTGDAVSVVGASFGAPSGSATIGGAAASIDGWTDTTVQLRVPASLKSRVYLQLQTALGQPTNRHPITVRGNDVWLNRDDVPEYRSYQTAVWTGTQMIVWGGVQSGVNRWLNSGGRYDPATDTWLPTSLIGAPGPRSQHVAVWTGTEMLVWGGYHANSGTTVYLGDGGRYDPATDSWTAMASAGAPSARYSHGTVWTGAKMVVWGGYNAGSLNTGARYDPSTNSWSPMTTTGAPAARSGHTSVWTGTEMIVWGGGSAINTGGRYNPGTDSWTATTTTGAPAARRGHSAVWTGNLMVVWGGNTGMTNLNTGGRYNPATNTWSPTGPFGVPSARERHSAVWTGRRMIVWGGAVNTGAQYDPATDNWTPTSTANVTARSEHTAVWNGAEMIVYGSGSPAAQRYDPNADTWLQTQILPSWRGGASVWTGSELIHWGGANGNAGVRYNPATDTFSSTSMTGVPQGRSEVSAVWTGTEMVVWGGNNSGLYLNTGGRYNPVTDSWVATATAGAPAGRKTNLVWTGTQMLAWSGLAGGGVYRDTGGRYDPVTNTWTAMNTVGAPSARGFFPAAWTGTELIVWGGYNGAYLNTGGRYNPVTDTWTATSTTSSPSARADAHAVWTGTRLIVYAGGGASGALSAGAVYDPGSDTWTPTPYPGDPGPRTESTAVWTGTEMIVWGGRYGSNLNTGGRFNPTTNLWTPVTMTNVPLARYDHEAVWTGSAMLVWGGFYGGSAPSLYLP